MTTTLIGDVKMEKAGIQEYLQEESIESVLETKNLDVHYGDKQAIQKISLPFTKNRITALIGPSGCGKSTYLRCLNRMNDEIENCQVNGEILYKGYDINHPKTNVYDIRKQIGMVFQQANPFAKSIYDNVAYGPKLHGIKKKRQLADIVEESLRKAALWDEVKDRMNQSALSLSGGQQQRLCIARTLALSPDVLLLDEPTSALDPVSTRKMEELMGELKKDYTLIIVTHNMQQASRISDYTAFFYMGELVEFDHTTQIFTNPKEEQTNNYISGYFG